MNRKSKAGIAILVGLCVALPRFLLEASMPGRLMPTDAQGGIYVMFSLIISGLTFGIVALFSYQALSSHFQRRRLAAFAFVMPVFFCGGWTLNQIHHLKEIESAMIEAEDPTTKQDRLGELIGFQTGFGYEIDNRIALNPNTPDHLLRKLHKRPGQLGTEMSLAQNPNTPSDVLESLSKNEDKWIQKALLDNPRFQRLKASNEDQ
ncbi:hypothetical protein [Luteolibacter sp. AS25]|uniref:hypothetical protein n=1 Tax=Luteolibacter sp. AS25 TaxID=3135776 RepID=UPI00398B2ABC